MKKIIAATAVLGFAAAVTAQTVTSANVVGYSKEATPAPGAFTIVSLNVLGEADTVDIQDAVANTDALNASQSLANADKIYVWTGSGYNTYGLFDNTTETFWMDSLASGWNKASKAAPSAQDIVRGSSVWFETGAGGSAADVMTAGEVPNDGVYDVTLAGSFDLVAYPYAASINIMDLVVSNGAASAVLADADKIYVWTGSGYNSYGLYDTGAETYWMDTLSSGWNKASKAQPSDADLDLGKGVWYEAPAGAKTIGFTQNYTLD